MECKYTGIGGLEASLKLNYVLVLPAEQAAMLHSELLVRGVPERQIYEVDPNRRPRQHIKSTICGPVAETSGAGGRKRGREKRFMPGSIKLGTYFAGGQQYNVRIRWGSLWISMADRASGADSGGASEVTVAGGGGVSEVSPTADSDGVVEVQPVVDNSAAVVAVSKKDDINMPMNGDGGRETEDANLTALDRDCETDNDDPTLGNGNQRCNSSSTLCEDCKRWLLHEYFDDRSHEELSDINGRHACIYRRIVDRLFVVTVTESGGAGDDDDENDDGADCCETTALDDIVVERPSTATDCATTNVAGSSEREQPLAGPTTPAQPAPPVPVSPGKGDLVDGAAKNVGEKPKKRTFFGKFCKSNNKTKKNLEPPKTD